jgi:hypothetical protein
VSTGSAAGSASCQPCEEAPRGHPAQAARERLDDARFLLMLARLTGDFCLARYAGAAMASATTASASPPADPAGHASGHRPGPRAPGSESWAL